MKSLEKKIRKHLVDRGWDQLRPGDVAKSIMIEGAELLELFQWENPELDHVRTDKEKLQEIKKELADILIYAIEMVVLLRFDARKIILKKLAASAKKYPSAIMRKHAKAGAGSGEDAAYWRIKRLYRRRY